MQDLAVIKHVEEATEWCALMVAALKKDEVRIRADCTELNQQISRKKVMMPTVKYSPTSCSGAKVFSKLDANAGHWHKPLAKESHKLTTFITPLVIFSSYACPFGLPQLPGSFHERCSVPSKAYKDKRANKMMLSFLARTKRSTKSTLRLCLAAF